MDIIQYIKNQNDDNNVLYKTNNFIRVAAFNMQLKRNIDRFQIYQLNKLNLDIMCLSEAFHIDVIEFPNHIHISSRSAYNGYMHLYVHRNLFKNMSNRRVLEIYKDPQYILALIDTVFGKIIIGVMQFKPRLISSEERKNALLEISTYCNQYDCPCIIAGNTNLRDQENTDLIHFQDAWLSCQQEVYYATWPNRTYDDKYSFLPARSIADNFRFDRIFYRGCSTCNFRTVNTKNSDHLMVVTDAYLGKDPYIKKYRREWEKRKCGCKRYTTQKFTIYQDCEKCLEIIKMVDGNKSRNIIMSNLPRSWTN